MKNLIEAVRLSELENREEALYIITQLLDIIEMKHEALELILDEVGTSTLTHKIAREAISETKKILEDLTK